MVIRQRQTSSRSQGTLLRGFCGRGSPTYRRKDDVHLRPGRRGEVSGTFTIASDSGRRKVKEPQGTWGRQTGESTDTSAGRPHRYREHVTHVGATTDSSVVRRWGARRFPGEGNTRYVTLRRADFLRVGRVCFGAEGVSSPRQTQRSFPCSPPSPRVFPLPDTRGQGRG